MSKYKANAKYMKSITSSCGEGFQSGISGVKCPEVSVLLTPEFVSGLKQLDKEFRAFKARRESQKK